MTSIYRLTNDNITASISTMGAEMISLQKRDKEYLYQKQKGFWQRQSPVLFPIVGALSDGAFQHKGETYFMKQHGFARDMEFSFLEQKENHKCSFMLRSNKYTHGIYPFDFELQVMYTLLMSTVQVRYIVKNSGKKVIHFSIGGHPAFAIDSMISEYHLQFTKDIDFNFWRLSSGLLDYYDSINVHKGILTLSEELFMKDALIIKELKSQHVVLWKKDKKILVVHRGNMPHFGIWRQVESPFICLEPWYGYASKSTNIVQELSEKEGIVSLMPGDTRNFQWAIEIF